MKLPRQLITSTSVLLVVDSKHTSVGLSGGSANLVSDKPKRRFAKWVIMWTEPKKLKGIVSGHRAIINASISCQSRTLLAISALLAGTSAINESIVLHVICFIDLLFEHRYTVI